MEIVVSKIQGNILQEFTAKYLEEHKELVEHIRETTKEQLILSGVSDCKRDETLELLEEIMNKVKEADSEVENGIYDPMLECAKHILNNYKIERR